MFEPAALSEGYQPGLSLLRDAALDMAPVSIGNRRTGSPHEFYRYPARFPPLLVRSAISAFSEVGDTVADYFLGGGTTLVEARMLGRLGVGADINTLATFVSRVKTRIYSKRDIAGVADWAARPISHRSDSVDQRFEGVAHITDSRWARLIELIASAAATLEDIESPYARDLARCSLLRASQWALDMRGEIPEVEELRAAIASLGQRNAGAAALASSAYRRADRTSPSAGMARSLILDAALPNLSEHPQIRRLNPPRLIVTSPPYPGVYVNYHRWKLQGRLETSLPYSIAGLPAPEGQAHYTMSARSDRTHDIYFGKLARALADMRKMVGPSTWVVQVVGFSDVESQLHRYLEAMSGAGFREATFPETATHEDGRLWRPVPRRRWWARAGERLAVAEGTAREVVLFHQLDLGREVTDPPLRARQPSAA